MKKNIIAIISLLCVLVLILGKVYVDYFVDEKPLDYSHLLIERRNISDEQNAYQIYREAYTKLSDKDELNDLKDSRNLTKIKAFLSKNRELIELFDKGTALSSLQTPDLKTIEDKATYFAEWRALSHLHSLRVALAIHEGNKTEVIELYRQGNLFIKQISIQPEILITYFVATSCRQIIFEAFSQSLSKETFTRDELGLLQEVQEVDWKSNFIDAFKGDLSVMIQLIDNLPESNIEKKSAIYLMNETRNLTIKNTEEIISQVDTRVADLKFPTADKWFKEVERKTWIPFKRNPVGIILSAMTLPASKNAFKRKDSAITINRIERLVIASLFYRLENGKLPGALSDFVPKYLVEIPKDPFDGKEMRYDTSKQVIYSIGENLVDDYGEIEAGKAFGVGDDIVFKFFTRSANGSSAKSR